MCVRRVVIDQDTGYLREVSLPKTASRNAERGLSTLQRQ